jgi:hypothetical protein
MSYFFGEYYDSERYEKQREITSKRLFREKIKQISEMEPFQLWNEKLDLEAFLNAVNARIHEIESKKEEEEARKKEEEIKRETVLAKLTRAEREILGL